MAVRIKDIDIALDNLREVLCDFKVLDVDGVIEDPVLNKLVEMYGSQEEDYMALDD